MDRDQVLGAFSVTLRDLNSVPEPAVHFMGGVSRSDVRFREVGRSGLELRSVKSFILLRPVRTLLGCQDQSLQPWAMHSSIFYSVLFHLFF